MEYRWDIVLHIDWFLKSIAATLDSYKNFQKADRLMKLVDVSSGQELGSTQDCWLFFLYFQLKVS